MVSSGRTRANRIAVCRRGTDHGTECRRIKALLAARGPAVAGNHDSTRANESGPKPTAWQTVLEGHEMPNISDMPEGVWSVQVVPPLVVETTFPEGRVGRLALAVLTRRQSENRSPSDCRELNSTGSGSYRTCLRSIWLSHGHIRRRWCQSSPSSGSYPNSGRRSTSTRPRSG